MRETAPATAVGVRRRRHRAEMAGGRSPVCRLVVAVAVGWCVLRGVDPSCAGEPTVSVVGVETTWEKPPASLGGKWSGLSPFAPVIIVCKVDSGGGPMLDLNSSKTKATMRDDTGKDLKCKPWLAKMASDRRSAKFSLLGQEAPAPGAKSIRVTGCVVLQTASASATRKSPVVVAKPGERIDFGGGFVFEIVEAGKPPLGSEPFMLGLQIGREIPEVSRFCFLTEDGEEVKIGGSNSASPPADATSAWAYRGFRLARKLEKFQLEVDVWTDLSQRDQPFDVTISLGGAR